MAKQKARDLVVSYVVDSGSVGLIDPGVLKAVEEGYRVVDIISTASGGGSSAFVTVLLTDVAAIHDYWSKYVKAK